MNEKKQLNLFDLVSIGVGLIIGAGIFSMLGTGIQYAGRSVTIAMILATILVFMEYFRPFIMSAIFELPGGMYDQSALTMPPVLIGVTALVPILSNLGLSVSGISISGYLVQVIPALAPYQTLVAFVVMTCFFAIAIRGSKTVSRFQNVMTICMYTALTLFIVFGILNRDSSTVAAEPFMPNGITGLMVASAVMSFSCTGATSLLNYTKDTKNAKYTVPRAFILSAIVSSILYALLGFAATSSLPYAEISGQNMGYIAQRIMPNGLYLFFVIGGAVLALSTSILGVIGGLKWPILAASRDGWLPAGLQKTTKGGIHWVVTLLMYLIAVTPILGGFSLDSIVSMILFPTAICSIAGNFVVWNLPKKFPKAWADNSLHMSEGVYHLCLIISSIAAAMFSVFTMIQSTPMIIANLAMTVFLFLFATIRYRSGKVHLAVREIYTE